MNYKFHLKLILLFSIPSLLFAEDTLIFAVDIIRHGDRTPIIPLPGVNYQWSEGPGQLTAEGMQQEYKLGMAFRKKYIEQERLLPEHYEQGTMYVRSTYYERTLMSAQSLLIGLYPPGTGPNTSENSAALPNGFQPIPVFSAPVKYDDVIIQQVSSAERLKLMEDYVYSTQEWQNKENDLQNKYPLWNAQLGMQLKSLVDLKLLGDSLYIHKLHHAPLPSGLTNEDIDTIISASEWAFMAEEKPQQVAAVYSKKIMTQISNYLQQGSQKNSKLKYVLLSAHDTTIANALSYLGNPLDKAPPYAANLNFALYERDANYFLVKVTYNGKSVSIPACNGMECELQQFIRILNTPAIGEA